MTLEQLVARTERDIVGAARLLRGLPFFSRDWHDQWQRLVDAVDDLDDAEIRLARRLARSRRAKEDGR